ncbi:MAG: UbiD family decarboxylase, partial [Desulfatiglandales bacterium]|nr:UbiD family decarboxylase [Desulfatiglandales bacterium]
DPKHEIGAICRKLNMIKGPAVLFTNVKGSRVPVVGQLLAGNRRLAAAIGCSKEDLFHETMTRANNLIPPQVIGDGPCQEVVKYGNDVDLAELPIVTNNHIDGAPYITAGHVILKDDELGHNLAIYRMMCSSKNELFIRFIPNHHGWAFLKKAEERKRPFLPVAVAIGVDPSIYMASQFEPQIGSNELEIAGGLRNKAVEVVKCKTIDVEVPAHAEIILECELSIPPKRGTEGPFGEFAGYTTGAVENEQIMTVKAITHTKNPIYHNIWLGKPPHEHLYINAISYASQAYHELKARFPAVKAVYAPPSGVSIKLVVQIDQNLKYPGMVNNLLASSAWTRGSIWKEVVVVDDDINIFENDEIDWAVVTRVQPDRDIFILSRCRGSNLDPTSEPNGVTSKIFIDATIKEGFRGTVAEPGREIMKFVDARWKEYGF